MLQLPIQREQWRQLWDNFRARHWLLTAPVFLCGAIGTTYACCKSSDWLASQAIVVRDEAIGGVGRLGSFESSDKLKASQETLLEVARSPVVIAAALREIGPPAKFLRPPSEWPTTKDIETLQSKIKVGAPRGAELGKTEVIYLSVSGESPQAAARLAAVIYDQLEQRLGELRDLRAVSIVSECERTLTLAQADLDQAVAGLKKIEAEVGPHLADLRALSETGTGEGSLKLLFTQLRSELRAAESELITNRDLRQQLVTAQVNPDLLVATPLKLLDAQPVLKKLREGLVAAQLKTAELLGNRSEAHPEVIAARRAEQKVRDDMFGELANAVRGLDAEINVTEAQVAVLQRQLDETKQQLDVLANLRAPYATQIADVRQREAIVENAKRALTDAQARQSSARATSLLTRIQEPVVSDQPEGPGRTALVGGSLVAGLLIGAGLLILAWPTQNNRRRWNDLVAMGRRATDRIMGQRDPAALARRANDPRPSEPLPTNPGPQAPARRATDPPPPPARRASDPAGSAGRRASDLIPPAERRPG